MITLQLGSLSGVTYCRLFLGHIHQRCADRCREDNVAVSLLFENSSSSLSSIESAIEVDIHNIPPLLRGIIFCCGARCDPGVNDNNVQFSKIFGNLLYSIFNFPLATNIGFVCHSLHIILGRDFCSSCCGGIGSVVDDGDLIMSTALFWGLSPILTLAPASANALDTSRPIPRAPPGKCQYCVLASMRELKNIPVTAATLPVRSNAFRTFLFSGWERTILLFPVQNHNLSTMGVYLNSRSLLQLHTWNPRPPHRTSSGSIRSPSDTVDRVRWLRSICRIQNKLHESGMLMSWQGTIGSMQSEVYPRFVGILPLVYIHWTILCHFYTQLISNMTGSN